MLTRVRRTARASLAGLVSARSERSRRARLATRAAAAAAVGMVCEQLEERRLMALIGVDPTSTFPDIQGGDPGSITYHNGVFDASAANITFVQSPGVPIAITPDASNINLANVHILVNNVAQPTSLGQTDLTVEGHVTIGTNTYDGVLITGKIEQFGYDFGNLPFPAPLNFGVGTFDFRFHATGGLLESIYFSGSDVGMRITGNNAGPFSSSFLAAPFADPNGFDLLSGVKTDIVPMIGLTTTPFVTTTTGGGHFATIGFWHNKNGQATINAFDSGPNSTVLGNALAGAYPNLFGAANIYGAPSLAGQTNAQVAQIYLNLWTPSGLQKNTYVQAFAVALGSYASGGVGTFNVGNNGAAFGVANGTTLTVQQILTAANNAFTPSTGLFFGGDSTKTSALNTVLNDINQSGESPSGPVVSSGEKLNDSATLSGGAIPTGGTITFYLMAPGSTAATPLSSAVYTDVVTVNGNGTYSTATMGTNSGGYMPTMTGVYQWVAVYSGDGVNPSITSAFGEEPERVGQQSPTVLVTVPSVTAVTLGMPAVLKDTADLEQGVNPTGTITWDLLGPDGTTVLDHETVNVDHGNGTYTTPTGYTLLPNSPVGTYQWNATYSGDDNNIGDSFIGDHSERVVVSPSPAITTTPFVTTTTGGGSFATIGFWHNKNGQATINAFDSGPTSTNLGNFLAAHYPHLFGASNPYTGTSLAGLTNAQVASVYLSMWTPNGLQKNTYVQAFAVALGSYASGGAGTFNVGSNGAAFGVANNTTLTVGQILTAADANFTQSTGLFYGGDSTKTSALNNVLNAINQSGESPSGPVVSSGEKLNDSATLSGGSMPTGTITFYLFAPGVTPNGTYSNNAYSDVVTVNGDGTYTTASGSNAGGYMPTMTGTYQWVAVYSGDGSNVSVTSAFGSEPQTVGQESPTLLKTTPNVTSILQGTPTPVTDTATFIQGVNPTGTIKFELVGPGSTTLYTITVNVNGNQDYTAPVFNLPAGAAVGTYQWNAYYSGDANNQADNFVNDPAERFTVVAAASINGTVFCDNDLDGVLDSGETREPGAIVTLYNNSNVAVGTKTTDSNGNYSFTGLAAGTYTVKLTTPSSGDLAEQSHGAVTIAQSYAVTLNSGDSATGKNFAEVDYGSISGTVFLDVDDNGMQGGSGETGIANVSITLTGTDYLGAAVSKTTTTDSNGHFSFPNLLPSNSTGYSVKETTPAGYLDGTDKVGTVNGVLTGTEATNDTISGIVLDGCDNDAVNYTFGEHGIFHGLTATIGFWHNQNGQSLINSFGTTSNGLTLANWLATNAPNLFGKNAPAFNVNATTGTNLTGRSNADVANYFLSIFGVTGNKAYAQVLATAFAVFTTTNSLDTGATSRALATKFGFTLSNTGTGATTYTVPSADWPAFGLTSSTATQTIAQLLLLANKYAVKGVLNNGDATKITETSDVFDAINNKGDIGSGMALVTDGSAGAGAAAGSIGQLYAGTYIVKVDAPTGPDAAAELTRIDDAIANLNASLGELGVTLVELPPDVSANPDIYVHFADTTSIGGKAQGVLGVTETGGQITLVDTWNYYVGGDTASVAAGQYDFETVITHELGHALGLGHSGDSGSVMYASLGTGIARRNLTASDMAQLDGESDAPVEALTAGRRVGKHAGNHSHHAASPQSQLAGIAGLLAARGMPSPFSSILVRDDRGQGDDAILVAGKKARTL